jgi:ribokinase
MRKLVELQRSTTSLANAGSITVLPDYFVDRFVRINDIDEFAFSLKKKARSGGGSIRNMSQIEVKGGNAVNLAYALGRLGASVNLFAISDPLASSFLLSSFKSLRNVHVDILKGSAGLTVALEFAKKKKSLNVMLSDVGSLSSFDGSSINGKQWARIETSKLVAVLNWSSNKKGTDLCERIFSRAKKKGAKTFLDPADLTGLEKRIRGVKKKVFDPGLLDVLSINENEARIIARELSNYMLPLNCSANDLEKAARAVSDSCGLTVDVHTNACSATCSDGESTAVRTVPLNQLTATGAGDVWDASDIACHLLKWEPEKRLNFANCAAGLYVSRENANAPTMGEIFSFMRLQKLHET